MIIIFIAWPQIKCEAIKETQTRYRLLLQNIHPLAVFDILRYQVLSVLAIAIALISTSQASEELKYVPTWPSRQVLCADRGFQSAKTPQPLCGTGPAV